MNTSLKYITVLLGAMILLSGCYLKSVHPLIKASESTYIERLDGVYEGEDQRWTFASDPVKAAELLAYWDNEEIDFDPDEGDSLGFDGYLVLFENLEALDAEPVLFTGYTGLIDGNVYLNLKIFDVASESFKGSHTLYVNTFSKLILDDNQLMIKFFKSGWIKDQILNNRLRIKHEVVNGDIGESSEILITASTKELRKFVEKYGNESDPFEAPIVLNRVNESL